MKTQIEYGRTAKTRGNPGTGKASALNMFLFLLFLQLILGCSGDDNPSGNDIFNENQVMSKTDFVSIKSVSYKYLDSNHAIRTLSPDPVRIFYSFQKAVEDGFQVRAEDLPVLVVFNGGPGAATSVNFMSMNTADITLSKEATGENIYAQNKFSWRKMANILYIDAPWTGFSYNYGYRLPCGQAYMGLIEANTFNCFIDADLMVRAMLETLTKCNMQRNKVFIVGESYGGTRATLMLNMLLFPEHYRGDPDMDHLFKDNALADLIDAHYLDAFQMTNPTPKQIAQKQFGKTVLVQPQLTGEYYNLEAGELFSKDGSIIDQLWEQHNPKNIDKWHRDGKPGSERCLKAISYVQKQLLLDPYFVDKNARFTDDLEHHAARGLMRADILSKLLNLSGPEYLKSIRGFNSHIRSEDGAYIKCFSSSCDDLADLIEKLAGEASLPAPLAVNIDDDPPSTPMENEKYDLRKYLGPLSGTCDAYFKSWDELLCFIYYIDSIENPLVDLIGRRYAKKINPDSVIYGEMFLHNAAVMDVMITNADKDIMIYSPAVAPSLKHYVDIVKGVDPDDADGYFTVHYQPGFIQKIDPDHHDDKRKIYHPVYKDCGHAVSVAKPEKLRKDMASFLGLRILNH